MSFTTFRFTIVTTHNVSFDKVKDGSSNTLVIGERRG